MNNPFSYLKRSWEISKNLKNLDELLRRPELLPFQDIPRAIPGAQVYLVGGSVRDFLLGGRSKDLDLAVTGATAEALEDYLKSQNGARVVFAGATFPVFKFQASPHLPEIDVALARTERSTGGGSLQDFITSYDPKVKIEEDLSRRDFTWNAIAINLSNGKIIDEYAGLKDLRRGVVRTVGSAMDRFAEDRTRALRALRFALKLDFKISPETWQAVKAYATRFNEKSAQGEFILKRELAGREFVKSIDANPVEAVKLWDRAGALKELFPEIEVLKYIPQRQDFHPEGDVYIHTLLALKSLKSNASLNVKLAVLFHDVGKATKFQIFDRKTKKQTLYEGTPRHFIETQFNPRLHLPKAIDHEADSKEITERIMHTFAFASVPGVDTERILYCIKEHMLHGLPNWKLAKRERLLFDRDGQPIWELYELTQADVCGSHRDFDYPRTIKRYIDELIALRTEAAKVPPRLIDGNDVMKEKNIQPGPEIKRLLEAVREKQLEELQSGKEFTREAALAFLRTLPTAHSTAL